MMEGGGQLLRMAITYSAVMDIPLRVRRIRGGRSPPGLKAQHLTAVRAVAQICGAEVRGLRVGSTMIDFKPERARGGSYNLDIGTAGSISLLLQCVAPVAAFADSTVELRVRGGTAVKWAPPTMTMREVVWRALRAMGFRGELNILREGFYPRGGGLVDVLIEPVMKLRPIKTDGLGEVEIVRGLSVCGRLPSHVAERQARAAIGVLREADLEAEVERRVLIGPDQPLSPGSYITLWVEADSPCYLGSDALGERGKRAERVGSEVAESLIEQLRTGMAVDLHTADNLILWCSLADGESSFTTSKLTLHTATAMELARMITGVEFEVDGKLGESARINCRGVGLKNPSL